jgi:pimeloyl-ACP methyl ester carboxylesterase
MRRLVGPDVIATRVRAVFRVDASDALAACPVPILYLRGTRDILVPAWNLRAIQRIRPDVQVVTIGRSHMLLQKHPVRAAEAIASFASSIGV